VLDGVLAGVVVSPPAALLESVLGADEEIEVVAGGGATAVAAGGEVVLEVVAVESEVVAGAVESEVVAGTVESEVVAGTVESEVVVGTVESEVVAGAVDAGGVLLGAGVEAEVAVEDGSALGAVAVVTVLGEAFLTLSLAP
jgi:hypothetical protein